MDFLTEVDKLVQLIECPIFTCKEKTLHGEGATRGASPPQARSPPHSFIASGSRRTNK